jgi:hypothetical protein
MEKLVSLNLYSSCKEIMLPYVQNVFGHDFITLCSAFYQHCYIVIKNIYVFKYLGAFLHLIYV